MALGPQHGLTKGARLLMPMPMIIGVPRSGTTLLRLMLDAHPLVSIPPETGFLAWASRIPSSRWIWMKSAATREALFRLVTRLPSNSGPWRDFGLNAQEFREELKRVEPFDVGEGLRAFYRLYAQKRNKPRYGDKTPIYCRHTRAIERVLPEAHFVHIIRDGRDVALSLRETWFAPGRDMRTLGEYWSKMVRSARAAGREANAYMEVRYEELVRDPAAVLEGVCRFLDLEFGPAMLRYWEGSAERLGEHRSRYGIGGRALVTHGERLRQLRLTMEPPRTDRIGCWEKEMTLEELSEFALSGGEMLRELGY